MSFEEVKEFELGYREGTINPDEYTFARKASLHEPIISDSAYTAGQIASALPQDTILYRVGVSGSFMVDEMIRSFDPNDALHRPDPSFNPFEVFKENGHAERDFDDIMEMENWEQYARFMERRGYRDEVREKISQGGLVAGSASLALNLVTDPTLYAGFGAVKMMQSGMSTAKSLAVAGGLSGLAYEGLEQFADQDRTAVESAQTVFFSAALAGVLGKGVDSWARLRERNVLPFARGVVKADNVVDDFGSVSKDAYHRDAVSLGERRDFVLSSVIEDGVIPITDSTQSLSAAIPDPAFVTKPVSNEIYGTMARVTGKGFKWFSPKLRYQTATNEATRKLGEKMYGLAARSEANFAGKASGLNVKDYVEKIENETTIFGSKISNAIRDAELKVGVKHDEKAELAAFLLASDNSIDIYNEAATRGIREDIVISAQYRRDHYQTMRRLFEEAGIEESIFRDVYGGPAMLSPDKIKRNIDKYIEKTTKQVKAQRANSAKEILKLNKKISRLEESIKDAQGLEKRNLLRKRDALEDDIIYYRFLQDAKDEELTDMAVQVARAHANGDFKYAPEAPLGKLNPGVFKNRNIDLYDYQDFIEPSAMKQAQKYAMDTKGFYGIKKVFGADNIDDVISDYKKEIQLADNYSQEEMTQAIEDLKAGWEQMTGEYFAKAPKYFGGGAMGDYLNAFADFTRVTKLGAQVIAALTEPMAASLHHGVKAIPEYTNILKKFSSSKEFREMTRTQARRSGAGLELVKNKLFMENFMYEYGQNSVDKGLSRYTSAMARQFQKFNGMVYFDDVNRTITSLVQDGMIAEAVERLATGGKVSKEQIADLAFLGIDRTNANKIYRMQKEYGEEIDGIFISNSNKWTDEKARDIYEAALMRDLRRTAVTPEYGDTPFWSKTPLGRLFFMFRGWGIAATQKYMISAMQRKEAGVWIGAAVMVGLGTAVEMLKRKASGEDGPEAYDVDELIYAGINRSGILGALPDFGGNYVMSKLFDFNTGVGRIADFQTPLETIAGAGASTLEDITTIAGYPFEEVDRMMEGKDAKGIESIYDEIWDLIPMVYPVEGIVKDEIRELQERKK